VYNIEQWAAEINSTFVTAAAKNYVPPTEGDKKVLADNYQSSFMVSQTIEFQSNQGHWKGAGSGSQKRFTAAVGDITTSDSIYQKMFTEKHIHETLLKPDIYDAPVARHVRTKSTSMDFFTPFSNISSELNVFWMVRVRTKKVEVTKSGPDTPSPYAQVTIDGFVTAESIQRDKSDFRPHWTAIKFVPVPEITSQEVKINYMLLDDSVGKNEVIPLSSNGHVDIAVERKSGKVLSVNGSPTNDSSLLRLSHQSNNVTLSITVVPVGDCNATSTSSPFSMPFCDEEAYTELGIHSKCADIPSEQEIPASSGVVLSGSIVTLLLVVLMSLQ